MKLFFSSLLEKSIVTILNDVGQFGTSLYPVFLIVCMIGIYINMMGAKEQGTKISSLSFLSYLILKVMASV